MAGHLHFDCFSGVSGDMTLAALLDLGLPEALLRDALASLNLPGELHVERVRKNGFAAIKIHIEAPAEDKHRHLSHIERIIEAGQLTDNAKSLALRMFRKLGEAEAASHGIDIAKVHFHEVGAIDSIFDFVGIAVGLDWLDAARVTSRAVPTGTGWVDCEHGRLPVPAPAVAWLLKGVPLAECAIATELTTPTGAAVLATLVDAYTDQPPALVERIGLGAGTKDFPQQPNLLRLFWGPAPAPARDPADVVWLLETNLDDVSGELIGHCFERLFAAGALDVYTTAIQMKKNRPGLLLAVIADEARAPELETILFRETGTFGVRKCRLARAKLARESTEVSTPWGPVKGKLGWRGALRIFTPEYDDCARLAREHGVPFWQVHRAAAGAYRASGAS